MHLEIVKPTVSGGQTVSGQDRHTFLADAVIGAHGSFADWVFVLVQELAAAAHRIVRRVDRFDALDFVTNPCPVLLSNYPSAQLVDAIERGDVRVLFVAEPPIETLTFMRRTMGISTLDAIRSQTASAVGNLVIGRSPFSRVLESNSTRSIAQIVDLIATHFELEITYQHRQQIAFGAQPDHCRSKAQDLPGAVDELTPEHSLGLRDRDVNQICQDVLEPLLAMACYGAARPVVWPTEVFTFADSPTSLPPANAAIVGPSRNLFYGPYFYLPPSRYRVEAQLLFSKEVEAIPFALEIHAGNWLARALIKEGRPGRFRGSFCCHHYDAATAVEIRLRNVQPIESGSLSLVEILFFAEPKDRA